MLIRTLGKLAIIFGIIGVMTGFFGGMFLTTSVGSIHIGLETTSDTFHLNAGNTYTIAAIGNNWPMGGGSGMIILHYMGGITTYLSNIGYTFDGDATYSLYVLGEISVSESGTYYMEFSEVQRNIYSGDISIEIQEPVIQSVLGISNSNITFGGIILIPVGIALIVITGKRKKQSRVKKTQKYPHSNLDGQYPEISCSMCGKIGDGKYCDDCGSALR